MFKFEEICELIRLVGSTRVASVEIERAESRVRIEGVARAQVVEVAADAASSATVPVAPELAETPRSDPQVASEPGDAPAPDTGEEGLHLVTSPIVGTFYRAPNPEADPYVKVGEFVDKGQVLCIVEAMKLMNEIESDVSGMVVRIAPENSQPIEFGETLFALRPS